MATCGAVTAWSAPAAAPKPAADRPYGGFPGSAGTLAGTSCSAASCHGGPAARRGGEHTDWAAEMSPHGPHDPHSRAYGVLFNKDSQRMAEYLDLGKAHQAPLCLKCHAVDGAGDAVTEGVGCTACHGPADKWLTIHYLPEWKGLPSREKFDRYDSVPTKNLVARVLACATCHVGDANREVNHDLIAAGHPRLAFEYTRFHYNPTYRKHWREQIDQPDFEVRAWVIGQVATARQAAELLRARAARMVNGSGAKAPPGINPAWPEFAGYSCYACHQPIGDETPRRTESAGARKPGSLLWEPWSTSAVRIAAGAAAELYPDAGPLPTEALDELTRVMAARVPDPETVKVKAAAAVDELGGWLARVQAAEDDRRVNPVSKTLPRELARKLAAGALADGKLADHDWDFLAAHYLGCAAMVHAQADADTRTQGRVTVPPWGSEVRRLRAALWDPAAAGFNSPYGFGPSRLREVRGAFENLRK
jgi:hypothetical protein